MSGKEEWYTFDWETEDFITPGEGLKKITSFCVYRGKNGVYLRRLLVDNLIELREEQANWELETLKKEEQLNND